jgi:hypothetical protein
MKFPVIELVDRYAISIVKCEKTKSLNLEEINFYIEQMKELDLTLLDSAITELVEIHKQIWDMEDDFKKCREENYSLEEIGRRALAIRDLNNRRVELKNNMADLANQSVKEIKVYNGKHNSPT